MSDEENFKDIDEGEIKSVSLIKSNNSFDCFFIEEGR